MSKLRDPLQFFRETVKPEFVSELLRACGIAPRAGIFTAVTVVWLMIAQRMNRDQTLAQAVESLRIKRERELLQLSAGSARARAGRISGKTGGYAQARKRIPLEVVEQIADRLNESVLEFQRSGTKAAENIFVVDGSTVQIAYTADNLAEYSQHENQHGKAHYPLVRICVATHAETGICCRPSYGPYSGPDAVGEVELAERLLGRLPKGATVIADRLFGCFHFVKTAGEHKLRVICRMKEKNAASVIGYIPRGTGEQEIAWTPSNVERKKYPSLAESSVRGRFVWCPITHSGKTETLILFTTSPLSNEEVLRMYSRRWMVETDLRDLKSTLKMNFIDAKSPEMIAKEIILGCCAYNLIRHMIGTAARAAKINARKFSFAAAIRRVHAIASIVFAELAPEHVQKALDVALTDVSNLMIPIRGSPRPTEPRKVWPRGKRTTFAESREIERKKLVTRKKNIRGR